MQFIDLSAQQALIREGIDKRIAAVLNHGAYIMGPEVSELEEKLAYFCGAKHCISCANGTDALQLVLMALGTSSGDAVFVPSFTFAATAEVIPITGATPFFVDIDTATFNMDPASLRRCISQAKATGLKPSAVVPVDLFGLPADYPEIEKIAAEEDLVLICDSAQGWGGSIKNKFTGTFGRVTTTSFFPAKPLGCYGDGGAIFTDDSELATTLESLRVHGKGREKYDNVRIGINSRLDTIQAAILLEKMKLYADEIERRNQIASRYTAALHKHFITPHVPDGFRSIWAQYTLQAANRDARTIAMAKLQEAGIPTGIYYPKPIHRQTAYSSFPIDPDGLPKSEAAAECAFSLPMHPYLSKDDQSLICEAIARSFDSA